MYSRLHNSEYRVEPIWSLDGKNIWDSQSHYPNKHKIYNSNHQVMKTASELYLTSGWSMPLLQCFKPFGTGVKLTTGYTVHWYSPRSHEYALRFDMVHIFRSDRSGTFIYPFGGTLIMRILGSTHKTSQAITIRPSKVIIVTGSIAWYTRELYNFDCRS